MDLNRHLVAFAEELSIFSKALRPGHEHLVDGLEAMSIALPTLSGTQPFVVADSPLHSALLLTAGMLVSSRGIGAAAHRAVDRLERRLNRLFEIGSAIEPKRRRPRRTARCRLPRRRLRAFSMVPTSATLGRG